MRYRLLSMLTILLFALVPFTACGRGEPGYDYAMAEVAEPNEAEESKPSDEQEPSNEQKPSVEQALEPRYETATHDEVHLDEADELALPEVGSEEFNKLCIELRATILQEWIDEDAFPAIGWGSNWYRPRRADAMQNIASARWALTYELRELPYMPLAVAQFLLGMRSTNATGWGRFWESTHMPELDIDEDGVIIYGFMLDYSMIVCPRVPVTTALAWVNTATAEIRYEEYGYCFYSRRRNWYANIPHLLLPVPMRDGEILRYDVFEAPGTYIFFDTDVAELYMAQLLDAGFEGSLSELSSDDLRIYHWTYTYRNEKEEYRGQVMVDMYVREERVILYMFVNYFSD